MMYKSPAPPSLPPRGRLVILMIRLYGIPGPHCKPPDRWADACP